MKISQKEIKRKQFYLKCIDCGQEIKGLSKSAVLWNLNIHRHAKHKDKLIENYGTMEKELEQEKEK